MLGPATGVEIGGPTGGNCRPTGGLEICRPTGGLEICGPASEEEIGCPIGGLEICGPTGGPEICGPRGLEMGNPRGAIGTSGPAKEEVSFAEGAASLAICCFSIESGRRSSLDGDEKSMLSGLVAGSVLLWCIVTETCVPCFDVPCVPCAVCDVLCRAPIAAGAFRGACVDRGRLEDALD